MLVLLMTVSGCDFASKIRNESGKQTIEESAANKGKVTMDEFNKLVQKDNISAGEIISFINEKISSVTQQDASIMIMALEKQQQRQLPKIQDKYAEDDVLQKKMAKDYHGDLSANSIDGLQDKSLKDLLLETKNNGFKIETAEGFYFPVINYSLYSQYRANVIPDIADYIDIMAAEAEKSPVKDGALMIRWDEIVRRAIQQEKFINQYSSSAKVEDVKQLLKQYLVYALYGMNNTPLFRYEDKQMTPEAKTIYAELALNDKDGSFSKIMTEYLTLVKKNDYTLTKEVENYRKKAEEEFLAH